MSFSFENLLSAFPFDSFDLWMAAGVLGLVFIFLFTIGRDFSVTLMLSVYFSLVSMTMIPFLRDLDIDISFEDYWVKLVIFGVLIAVFFWLQVRNEFFEPYTVPTGGEVIVFVLVISGMILYAAGTMIPELLLLDISPLMRMLFLDEPAANVWFTLPILTMLFLRGRT
ncbi:MAG: hypothetical protein WC730_00070 [Patescibacteria group bacterium]|jgi:hypothetical protein